MIVMCSFMCGSRCDGVLVIKGCGVQGCWVMMEDECPRVLSYQGCSVMNEDKFRRGLSDQGG